MQIIALLRLTAGRAALAALVAPAACGLPREALHSSAARPDTSALTREIQAAIASYRRALALNADSDDAQRQIQWAEDRVAARARPVAVSQQVMERYVGQYQQQAVAVRNGRLYYQGAVSPESPLSPIAEDLFEVDADPTLRIHLVGDRAGSAVKLIGIYSDGTMDEWARSQ